MLVSHSRHRVPITDFPTKFSLTKFGSEASTLHGAGDFNEVPFNVAVMTGTVFARRLLLLDERNVDLPLFFFNFLSLDDEDSDFSRRFPFLFSSLTSEKEIFSW